MATGKDLFALEVEVLAKRVLAVVEDVDLHTGFAALFTVMTCAAEANHVREIANHFQCKLAEAYREFMAIQEVN
jgi:hypothetical protein